jgi:hypothetical protein
MTWQFRPNSVNNAWIGAVRAATWPLGAIGGGSNPVTTAKTVKASSTKAQTTTVITFKTSTAATATAATSKPVIVDTSSVKTAATVKTSSIKTSTTATRTSSSATSTSTGSSSGGCGTVSAWNPETTYWADDTISYNGSTYTAKWWSVNDVPTDSDEWGVWRAGDKCGKGKRAPAVIANVEEIVAAAASRKMVRSHRRSHH